MISQDQVGVLYDFNNALLVAARVPQILQARRGE